MASELVFRKTMRYHYISMYIPLHLINDYLVIWLGIGCRTLFNIYFQISSETTPASIPDSLMHPHNLPRQCSLPSLSLPYMPRTPPKESYTLEDFQCKYCHRPFFSKRELSKHTESVHFIEVYKPSHWCSVCTSSFSTDKELTKHMQSYHGGMESDGGTTCQQCFLKFQHARLLTNHMTMYHIPHMSCSLCSKRFSDVGTVWNHLLDDHKVKPKEIKCNLCDAVFENPTNYDEHNKAAHAFPCLLCQKSVEDREKLHDHMEEVHNKHFCADCAEIFCEFEGYVQHFITNEKCSLDPYKLICRYCNGMFPNLKLLFKHLCLDSFKCVFCESSSISCKTFQNHLNTSHNTKLRYVSHVSPVATDKQESEPRTNSATEHRLVPSIISDFQDSEKSMKVDTSNGNPANYIHNLIQVNENLLKSKPRILSKYSSASSDSSSSQSSLMKLYNTPEFAKFLQTHNMQSIALPTPPDSVKLEPEEMDCSQDSSNDKTPPRLSIVETDCSDSLLQHSHSLSPTSGAQQYPHESFSSLEDDVSDINLSADLDDQIDGDGSAEFRRNSIRMKYQQLSISGRPPGRRSSKSSNKMLCKSKTVEEVSEISMVQQNAVANAMSSVRSSFICQRCSKTFVNRSLLSRHWGSATKCYICSKSMCDLKVLNEHMKSEHSEYSDL